MIRRLRKFILITGTLLSVLIVAAFVASAWWWVWVKLPDGQTIGFHAGAIEYAALYPASGWGSYFRHPQGLQYALAGRTWTNGFKFPLIYPFAAVAIPTLLVWRFWPKPIKPGHCRCGYNLTGNTSGVCPECGFEMPA